MEDDTRAVLEKQKAETQKAVEHTLHEFDSLHTGKASPGMVEGLSVDVSSYGSTMSLRDISAITTPDARTIHVQPWDRSVIKDIEKAIQKANLGINPMVDGDLIRLSIPELSRERRVEMGKIAGTMGEDGKIGVRQARRTAMDTLKTLEKDGAISEDEAKRAEKEVQKVTDDAVAKIEKALEAKQQDLLKV
ncbi:MAG: ribosome recycling factor [Puniceicoccaceae bacterium]